MQKYLTVDRLAFGMWPTQFNPPASKDFVTSRMDAFEKYGETRNSTKYDVTVNIRSMLLRLVMLYAMC